MKRFTAVFNNHKFEVDDIGDIVSEMKRLNIWPTLVLLTCNTCKSEHRTGPDVAPAHIRIGNDIRWEAEHQHV